MRSLCATPFALRAQLRARAPALQHKVDFEPSVVERHQAACGKLGNSYALIVNFFAKRMHCENPLPSETLEIDHETIMFPTQMLSVVPLSPNTQLAIHAFHQELSNRIPRSP